MRYGVRYLHAAALCLASLLAAGQTSEAPRRIGILASGSEASSRAYQTELRDSLRGYGYVDGKNAALVYRYANGDLARLPQLAKELAEERVEVVFAGGDQVIAAMKRATTVIPIVMVACDAVAAGLISSLARPEGNLTGVTCINSDLAGKRLEIMGKLVPKAKGFGVVINPDEPRMRFELSRTESAAGTMALKIRSLTVKTADDFKPALNAVGDEGLGGAIVVFDALTFFHRKQFADTALAAKVPTIYNFREYVEAGGLISYGPNLGLMYRQAAAYIDRILKGAVPRELPIQQPTKFELTINLKTAKAIGITIPESVLLQVDKTFE